MGNQNHTPRHSMRRPTRDRLQQEEQQPQIIDLDEIVEQWIWHMWNRTKTKSLSHYKREELLITINWKRVVFIQSNTHFCGVPPIRLPKSQILFRTNFNNKTMNEQSYTFKTERFTRSIFNFTFKNRLIKSQESAVTMNLPQEIAEIGGGIKREQNVELGQYTTKEYEMRWHVDSQIRVPPRSCIKAELNIDEEECFGDFLVHMQFFGRITATIATRQSPDTHLKFIDGDIVQIVRETMENNPQRCKGLEIFSENSPVVKFTLRGDYSFRYGVQQHIILKQELLDTHLSSFLTQKTHDRSLFYRPLQSYLTSSNSDIHLHVENEEIL